MSSDEEYSGAETEAQDADARDEDRHLKDKLLRKFGSHIGSLKLEFSKKKKKGKLPKESRQTLLDWWNAHYKWPYPTVNLFTFKLVLNLASCCKAALCLQVFHLRFFSVYYILELSHFELSIFT